MSPVIYTTQHPPKKAQWGLSLWIITPTDGLLNYWAKNILCCCKSVRGRKKTCQSFTALQGKKLLNTVINCPTYLAKRRMLWDLILKQQKEGGSLKSHVFGFKSCVISNWRNLSTTIVVMQWIRVSSALPFPLSKHYAKIFWIPILTKELAQ